VLHIALPGVLEATVALGSPRRAVAAATTAVAAVAIAFAVAGRGCGGDADGPAGAVRALLAAARAGDREQVLALLGPATRARLDRAAARASELEGGGRRHRAIDLLEVGAPDHEPLALAVQDEQGDRAAVELVDRSGARTRLELVRVGGAWRVELPAAEPAR
jgi:hypothetical protein